VTALRPPTLALSGDAAGDKCWRAADDRL